jgi:hypothetical protein
MIHRFIHYVRRQWQIYRAWRHFREQAAIRDMQNEAGYIPSRMLSQRDTVECCRWVLENCPRSLRSSIGRRTANIARQHMEIAQRTVANAVAQGLAPEDDWALQHMWFVIEDPRERMLFKLAWGGR